MVKGNGGLGLTAYHHQVMRVVAGTAGGRQLKGPVGVDARPTMDKVRAAIFNSLGSLQVLHGASVVDLFAGTGACGIEALSRGASSAVFVENFRPNVDLIRENLASTKLEGQVQVEDVMTFIRHPRHFDIAFVDPPYAFDEWSVLLENLRADVVVCESNRPVDLEGGWDVLRQKRYGGTHVTMLQRTAKESELA